MNINSEPILQKLSSKRIKNWYEPILQSDDTCLKYVTPLHIKAYSTSITCISMLNNKNMSILSQQISMSAKSH